MKTTLFFILFVCSNIAFSQDPIMSVRIDRDTILMDNVFTVKFLIENAKGDFEAPDFEGFDVMAGPNMSSSVSIINGDMKQSISYAYILKPKKPGIFYIKESYISDGEIELETEPLKVIVEANPLGIIQENKKFESSDLLNNFPDFDLFTPKEKKKPKSKVKRYKI